MDFLEQYKTKLEKLIESYPSVNKVLITLEDKTKVKKVYIAFGVIGVLILWLAVGYAAQLLCNAIGFVYPAFCSIKALESKDKKDDTQWLMYWVVFALFSIVEFFSDLLVGWVPFYWLAKCLFLVWCMSPLDGSTFIYSRFILPFFHKNQTTIDNVLNKSKDAISNLADEAIVRAKAMGLEGDLKKAD